MQDLFGIDTTDECFIENDGCFGQNPTTQSKSDINKFTLASGLYKYCRIGDYLNAIKFAELLKRTSSEFYVFRILSQLCGEDLSPNGYAKCVPVIRCIFEACKNKDLRGHDLWQCVYLVATAEKWYMSKEGIELEEARHLVNDKNKQVDVKIKCWLFDYHTKEGRSNLKNADLRLDGRWENRFNILDKWTLLLRKNKGDVEKTKIDWIDSFQ